MPELTSETVARALMYFVVLLFSLSFHESAHAWMALRMGDDTAARQGRITLNPLSHIDPFGTLLMPLLQVFFSQVPLLAWAKPTPLDPQNLRKLARGRVLVAAAGPVSNVILAVVFTVALILAVRVFGLSTDPQNLHPMTALLTVGVQMNVVLALFNLVPLPPLDGSQVVSWGLPRSITAAYDRVVEPYGHWILLVLFATGILARVLSPITRPLAAFLLELAR